MTSDQAHPMMTVSNDGTCKQIRVPGAGQSIQGVNFVNFRPSRNEVTTWLKLAAKAAKEPSLS
jgi:hypothetical protein